MGFVLRAVGDSSPSAMISDEVEIRKAIELFADRESGVEVMALTSGVHRTLASSDVDGVVKAVGELPGGIGVYFRINPVPATMTRPAKDADVIRRRWLYVDIDPVKPEAHKNEPSTNGEKALAGEVADSVIYKLSQAQWPAPVIVDSGNGYALFWRCDLPNDALTRETIKRFLASLSREFSGNKGQIDKAVHNAGRLVKLPGTWARKGTDTQERPHRPCQIVMVPANLLPVTFDQITAAIVEEPKAVERNGDTRYEPPPRTEKPATGGKAYATKALDNECARVVFATQRNNALNRAAFSLGQLVASGLLSESEVVERLTDAARQSGLDRDTGCGERGIALTIASGLKAGREFPRKPDERPEPRAVVNADRDKFVEEVKATDKKLTVRLSRVQPKKVDWLVPGRIPKRFITIMAGRTGVGKSFVSHDIVARLTTGNEIPCAGGLCFEKGGALIISEDPPEYIIAPRLIALGADLNRVNCMTWESMHHYHLGDTDMLGLACDEVEGGVSLVMIDPPTNFLQDVDEHKNSEVRQLVMRVVEWASGRDVAVLFVLHVNKQTGKGIEALNRVMGSVAWVSTARIAHSFCLDPDDPTRGLWMPTKSNLGQLPKGLAYRITGGDTPGVEWLGEVDITADEAMSSAPKARKRGVVASEWLIERFREKREWRSEDLFAAAKEENVSKNAIYDAKDMLALPKAKQSYAEDGSRSWIWWVPDDWQHLAQKQL